MENAHTTVQERPRLDTTGSPATELTAPAGQHEAAPLRLGLRLSQAEQAIEPGKAAVPLQSGAADLTPILSPAERTTWYSALISHSARLPDYLGTLPPEDLRAWHQALAKHGRALPQLNDVSYGTGSPNPLIFEKPQVRLVSDSTVRDESRAAPVHPFASMTGQAEHSWTFAPDTQPVHEPARQLLAAFAKSDDQPSARRFTTSHSISAQLSTHQEAGRVVLVTAGQKLPIDQVPTPVLATASAAENPFAYLPAGLRPGEFAELLSIDGSAASTTFRFSHGADSAPVDLDEFAVASHFGPVIYVVPR